MIYYRKTEIVNARLLINNAIKEFEGKQYSNLYQVVIKYPFDRVRSVRISAGIRTDKVVIRGDRFDTSSLKTPDQNKQTFGISRLEYVYDNSVQKATNILNGLRYKVYVDLNIQTNKAQGGVAQDGRFNFNAGADARYYYPIYRNFIWAGRAAADFPGVIRKLYTTWVG